ncbi:4-formylbenzenesulfonate dehydrogenase TsaC1/TsaC2 [Methylobacterium crusticola]|uniref:4-formylbenzenesulfonate dehydrogenase TsaC1/TsaC2 n=1 Tax=Methylobacterium crusticola TaxID=1697972 RepID=A0ABQ4R3X7_9HYPH|nr:SDR family oxidoreductase [Methylobacterium crusticola]GJD52127.1 4-formylbenzenesulfonate dehydrogenase TsaC1/TsaC2 [Methylobacterium crusticola]
MTLEGRIAVVTGGGSGIGAATARLLAEAGARVAVIDRDRDAAQASAAAIASAGGTALARASDVGDPAASLADAAAVAAQWGGIDVLVAAAGFSCGGTVETTDPADWDAVFRTNVGGTWLWARAVIPSMRARGGGAIVTLASQLALAGGRGNSAYIAAKGAILSLTRTMALDLAGDRIRVNALVPGAIETPMLARSFRRAADPDAVREASRARHPLGRFGRAEEVARAALFLAGDASSFTTGAAIPVDGGWLAA